MQRNIFICYLLTAFRYSWFWLGIWVFYYLKFTNYAGIGLLESYQIIAITLSEVPTGAVADIFGKKATLILSFLLLTIGMGFFAFAPSFVWFFAAVIIAGIGSSFFNGTVDALLYDSLKQLGQEEKFSTYTSRINSVSLLFPAICGIIGGFLYILHPNLPYVAQGIFCIAGIIAATFLTEPTVKEEKTPISIRTFVHQTRQGFSELFKQKELIHETLLLILIGTVCVICFEMLNDFLAVEFTFKPTQLAIVWSIFYVICAVISHITPIMGKYISYKTQAILLGFGIALTLIVSPLGGIIIGGTSILFRAVFQTLFNNSSSILINQRIDSKYRTTTLSTFNLLKNLPYVLTAFFLGYLADTFSAIRIAFFLGILLLVFMAVQSFFFLKKRET